MTEEEIKQSDKKNEEIVRRATIAVSSIMRALALPPDLALYVCGNVTTDVFLKCFRYEDYSEEACEERIKTYCEVFSQGLAHSLRQGFSELRAEQKQNLN